MPYTKINSGENKNWYSRAKGSVPQAKLPTMTKQSRKYLEGGGVDRSLERKFPGGGYVNKLWMLAIFVGSIVEILDFCNILWGT